MSKRDNIVKFWSQNINTEFLGQYFDFDFHCDVKISKYGDTWNFDHEFAGEFSDELSQSVNN